MSHPPVYVLRHGETRWNREGRMQGQRDSALTALGQVQAARQGAILRRLAPGAATLASPLGRAARTARLAGLWARPDPRLKEIGMGAWEGRLRADLTDAPGLAWKFEAPGGEGETTVLARIDDLLAGLQRPTILVTHGVLAILLRARLRGLGPTDWDDLDDPQGVVHRIAGGVETLHR